MDKQWQGELPDTMSEAPDGCCHRAWKLSMAEKRIDGCLRGRKTMRTRLVQSELHASLDTSSAWRTRCAHQGQVGEAHRRLPLNDIAHWRTCQRSFAESTEIFTTTAFSIWQMTWYLKLPFLQPRNLLATSNECFSPTAASPKN